MSRLKQYGLARVRLLKKEPSEYDGWGVNQRPPAVGDVGTLIDILTAPDGSKNYVVEASGPDGISIWLGDFSKDELEAFTEEPNKAPQTIRTFGPHV
jgi:hypothetical protein